MSFFRFIEPAQAALGVPLVEVQIAAAESLVERYYPNLSTDRPALIGAVADARVRERLSKSLLQAYPGDHQITLVGRLEEHSPVVEHITLAQLGQVELDRSTWLLYVPPLSCPGALETFQDTVAHLRAPEGCPWDREQTHQSLRQGFQEEAYEVLDALDRGDIEHLKEELGDILLHILLQAQIASEQGEFRMSDVICRVNTKIIHRHPHVFAGLEIRGVGDVMVNWEELKQREKEDQTSAPSSLDGIALAMPALARAQSIQRHVDRMGVVSEGVQELEAHILRGLAGLIEEQEPGRREMHLGELLFALSNLARKLDVDAESALRETNSRLEKRYREVEQAARRG